MGEVGLHGQRDTLLWPRRIGQSLQYWHEKIGGRLGPKGERLVDEDVRLRTSIKHDDLRSATAKATSLSLFSFVAKE